MSKKDKSYNSDNMYEFYIPKLGVLKNQNRKVKRSRKLKQRLKQQQRREEA